MRSRWRLSGDHGHGAVLNDAEVSALLAEIDRLTRERDEARAENTKLHGWYEDAEQRVMAERRLSFRAERDALAKDAARYRFLRTKHVVETMNDGELCIHYACDFEHYNDPDASIDAALAQIEQEKANGTR